MAAADVVNLGEFEHMVLLAIMRLGEDAYAVPVRDEIARCTGRDVSRGSIYTTLIPVTKDNAGIDGTCWKLERMKQQ